MSPLVPLVMYGWIPIVLYLFYRYPANRAVITSFVVAWLFLPQASFALPGLPDYTKMSATCYGVLLATVIFDSERFTTFRLSLIDIPILIWCFCPILSSLSNDLGLYDGFSASLTQFVAWGLPYFVGRVYLSSWEDLRQLAIGFFYGGLVYLPFIYYELRMSPQLHRMFYGFAAHSDFAQTIRYGGYRPMVFMQHGLAVGAWMMAATLVGIWLWQTGTVKQVLGIPMKFLVPFMAISFILCKSTGAILLLLMGMAILYSAKWFRTPLFLILVIAIVGVYLHAGATGIITPERREAIVAQVADLTNEARAESLNFRMVQEEMLSEKARERVWFGWGGWGRARIYDSYGKDISVTDSLWIIAFGNHGLLGLISLTVSVLLAPLLFCLRGYSARTWANPVVAPASVLATIITLYMVDCVLNAMINPIYIFALGGVSTLVIAHPAIPTIRKLPRTLRAKKQYALQNQ